MVVGENHRGSATWSLPSGAANPRLGTRIGRYRVIERIGAGSVGVMVIARDPKLERAVAIKVLPPAGRRRRTQRRVLEEAREMARLSHPNLVPIIDVGEEEGRVFVVMEFVRGTTLCSWLAGTERKWHDVVSVLLEAGRGLSAAHREGLLHGDFKPANVLVTDAPGGGESARVLDFGLAALPNETPPERPGSLPLYMAPEQLANEGADARSDQFSFCVTLYRSVYGSMPFHGPSMIERAMNVLEGRVRRPAPDSRVPRWLFKLIRKGLSRDPARRFASMDDLLRALARGLARSARPRLYASGALAFAVAAVAACGAQHTMPSEDPSPPSKPVWTQSLSIPASLDAPATPAARPNAAGDAGQLSSAPSAGATVAPTQPLAEEYWKAAADGRDRDAADAAIAIVRALCDEPSAHRDAQRWARHAAAMAQRSGDQLTQAALHEAVAELALARGDHQSARDALEWAVVLRERVTGPNGAGLGRTLEQLGATLDALGSHEAAVRVRARAIRVAPSSS